MSRRVQDRRNVIVQLATTSGLASVEKLSEIFGVTSSTIRRDLAKLESAGHLVWTYGGAMAFRPRQETTSRQHSGEAFEAKHAIATWATRQVRGGETVLLDSGSTISALARWLAHARNLTVVTNGRGWHFKILLLATQISILTLSQDHQPGDVTD